MDYFNNFSFSDDPGSELREFFHLNNPSSVFVIVDENTKHFCLPKVSSFFSGMSVITIKSGDENKTIEQVQYIWNFLQEKDADRKSIVINLGGGVVTDIGGFAASTFKRGLKYINIPTTLLAQADAGIGGKTGINFNNVKNLIGTFYFPEKVIINPVFLNTLDNTNFLSGFAEIIKHSLIAGKNIWGKIMLSDPNKMERGLLKELIFFSVNTKMQFVKDDPFEQNSRKALNFGHTFGHAFESLYLSKNKSFPHGYAIAAGMICESFLSVEKLNLDKKCFSEIRAFLLKFYGKPDFSATDFDLLFQFILQDKKNEKDHIKITLLTDPGNFKTNIIVSKKEIFNTFAMLLEDEALI